MFEPQKSGTRLDEMDRSKVNSRGIYDITCILYIYTHTYCLHIIQIISHGFVCSPWVQVVYVQSVFRRFLFKPFSKCTFGTSGPHDFGRWSLERCGTNAKRTATSIWIATRAGAHRVIVCHSNVKRTPHSNGAKTKLG
jgi:hypothetical protein